MEKKSSWKTNGFLKGCGVLLLMILCGIACISGGLTILQVNYDGDDNWFDTETSVYRIQSDGRQVLADYIDNENQMPANDIYDNVTLSIDKWNKDKFEKVYEGGSISGDPLRTWSYMYCVYPNMGNEIAYMEHGRTSKVLSETVSPAKDEEIYVLSVEISAPLQETDAYYYEYTDFNTLKMYRTRALPVFIGTLWIAVFILILEIISAGHTKEEDGIHLSWMDRVPFDVFSFVVFMGIGLACAGLLESLDSGLINADLRNIQYAVLPMSCIEILSLLIYFWIITLTVRIKSHTLLSNNVIIKLLVWVYQYASKYANKISLYVKDIMREPKWWLGFIAGGYGLGLLVQICILDYTGFNGFLVVMITAIAGLGMLGCGRDFMVLLKASEEISKGNLEYRIEEKDLSRMKGPFLQMGQYFTEIGNSLETAVGEKIKSERMKTELITNVSHDLKTPLTSIINYVDLLKKEHTDEQEKEYLDVLDRQSQRLKRLTEDVVEASKASTGNINVNLSSIDVQEIIEQSVAEYEDKLENADLKLIIHNMDEHMKVTADGRLLWRSVRNLLSNICKYAMPSTRVYIDVVRREHNVVLVFKNTSRDELNITADELKERFVRGDSSRHVEGSGLGLSIVESLMQLMGGKCDITVDGDLFKAELSLPEAI